MNIQLATLFVVANCFDLLTTHLNGQASEANPIVGFIWRSGGFLAVVAFKLASTVWGVYLYNKLLKPEFYGYCIETVRATHLTFWGLTLLLTLIVGWNTFGYWYNSR